MSFFDSDRYPSHKLKKDIVSNTFMLNILYPFQKSKTHTPHKQNKSRRKNEKPIKSKDKKRNKKMKKGLNC